MVRSRWVGGPLVLVSAGVMAVGVVVAAGGADAAGVNRRPVCNSTYFNVPTPVGASVSVPVLDFAADPDLTPVRLVSVFDVGWPRLGTVVISDSGTPGVPGDDVLVFTRTENVGTASLYWTVSDGSLSAQCSAYASNVPPPDNG